jgi:acyl-CoA dehydrogenase
VDTSYRDWPFLDDAHRALAAEISAWTEAEIAPTAHDDPENDGEIDAACRGLVRKLAADGWLGYCVPAPHGGRFEHIDVRSLCLIRETLAYHSGLADFSFVMQGLGSGPISLFGTEAQKADYLPKVAAGNSIAAFGLSEPDSGSDVAAMKTEAVADGTHYVLNGEKTLISNAGIADLYTVIARTGEAPGSRGLSAFIVEADTPGLSVTERFRVIAPHPLGTVTFADCRVPRANLIAGPGDGFKVAMSNLDVFRTSVAAAALGFARRAMDEAVSRAQTRESFGKALSEYQLIQEKISDMAVDIDAAALLVYRSAWTKDTRESRGTREVAMAKFHATEMAQRVIDQAVQIWGGQGVVVGNVVERLYREIRALRIYEGTSEIQKLIIAGQVLMESGKG